MALRVRRSIGLGGGVRLNVGKRSLGLSAGTRGLRYSVSTSGRRTSTVGLPGTGLSYVRSRGAGSRTAARSRPRSVPSGPPTLRPGLLAPGYEKSFFKGLAAFLGGDSDRALAHFKEASQKDARDRAASDDLFAGCLAAMAGDAEGAIPYLESVVSSDIALPDELMQKYCPGLSVEVGITERVRAQVEMGSLSAALILAECYERVERKDEAIGLLQRLLEVEPDPALTLSLCELYADAGEWDEIVDVAAGVKNEDDVTLEVCLFQTQALVEQAMPEAALEVFRDALRARNRDAQLLKAARYGRGRLLLDLGKTAQGRKDLARVYADDPKYLDVAELLGGPPAGG